MKWIERISKAIVYGIVTFVVIMYLTGAVLVYVKVSQWLGH